LKIVEQAKEMMLHTDRSIADIAKRLTYDPSNFSKFFRKFTGQTPGAFRKLHKK
jgi:AraC-like DNA-binding protein